MCYYKSEVDKSTQRLKIFLQVMLGGKSEISISLFLFDGGKKSRTIQIQFKKKLGKFWVKEVTQEATESCGQTYNDFYKFNGSALIRLLWSEIPILSCHRWLIFKACKNESNAFNKKWLSGHQKSLIEMKFIYSSHCLHF